MVAEPLRSLSAADVLHAWEMGQRQNAVERMLTLLGLSTGVPRRRLAGLSIGQRDALLLLLRELTLGSHLESSARCPQCSEQVEMSFDSADIRLPGYPDLDLLTDSGAQAEAIDQQAPILGEYGAYHLTYRLPDSYDLAAIVSVQSVDEAHSRLLSRCVLEARTEDALVDPADLPFDVLAWLGERIAQADPQGDILLDLCCPNCDHRWQAIFDISAFFWREIAAISRRLLQDVHTLASAYGWSEEYILNMTAVRRQAYLDMVLG
jgi:hypothetical protein